MEFTYTETHIPNNFPYTFPFNFSLGPIKITTLPSPPVELKAVERKKSAWSRNSWYRHMGDQYPNVLS